MARVLLDRIELRSAGGFSRHQHHGGEVLELVLLVAGIESRSSSMRQASASAVIRP